MKLVNTHKQLMLFLLFAIGLQTMQAQAWTLGQCIKTAEVNNKNLQLGRNNVLLGEQRQKEASANLMPKITANVDYKYFITLPYQFMPQSAFGGPEGLFNEVQFGVPHNINANIQLAMPLYNPQVRSAIQTTEIATEIAELQYQKTEEQLFFDISNLYYNAQILLSQRSFLDSNLMNANQLLSNMQLLHEQLMLKGTDVSKVQLQVNQLTTQKALIISKYDQVMNGLKFAMGISIGQNIDVESVIEYKNNIEYTPSSTLDFRLATTRNQLFKNEMTSLKTTRLPTISLYGSYGYNGYGYDQAPNKFLTFYPSGFAGIKLTYSLFNKTTQLKINQKAFELQNSDLQINLVADQNKMQVQNAYLQKTITQQSIETTLQQIELAQSIYDQTVLQQKQGTASLNDVLLVDNTLREAQQTYLSAVVDYLKADLELKKLTGNF